MTGTAHASGARLPDGRWQCKCGAIVASGEDWRDHVNAARPQLDPPGTCHKVSCPGKGIHPPHGITIGAGTWNDYTTPTHCLGFPQVEPYDLDTTLLVAHCSVDENAWDRILDTSIDPADMAILVDLHKRDCSNRSPSVAAQYDHARCGTSGGCAAPVAAFDPVNCPAENGASAQAGGGM